MKTHNVFKKISAIFVILVFCTSSVTAASLVSIPELRMNALESPTMETVGATKTVTLYRYGPDGSITPMQVDVTLEEGRTLGEILADKCSELVENDAELQKFLQDYIKDRNELNRTFGVLSKVKSHGKGFHFKTRFRIRIVGLKQFKIFPLLPPYFKKQIRVSMIYCRYPRDDQATTTITPLIGGENATKYVEGNHTVFVFSFVGFAGWFRRFSPSPLNIIPRAFAGYALLVNCRKTLF